MTLDDDLRVRLSRALTWVLAIALLCSVGGVVYVAANPPETTDPYTEFYILGPSGNASGYPTNLTVGERGELIVGVSNHEHETTTYTVALVLANQTVETRTITVADEETWQETMAFTAQEPGRQRLRILLYHGEETTGEPYRWLRLWVNVSAS